MWWMRAICGMSFCFSLWKKTEWLIYVGKDKRVQEVSGIMFCLALILSCLHLLPPAPGLSAGCVVVLFEDLFHLLLITYLCLFKYHSALSTSPDRCLTWVLQRRPNHCLSFVLQSFVCFHSLLFLWLFPEKARLGQVVLTPDQAEPVFFASAPPPPLPQSYVKSVMEGLLPTI